MHTIGHRERLRQRFTKTGIDGVADYELLELLLMQSISRRDVKPLAKNLLIKFKSLSGVLNASVKDLKKVEGIGVSAAFSINLARGMSEAYRKDLMHKEQITDRFMLLDYLYSKMDGLKHEEFHAVYLDSKNYILSDEKLFRGTVNKTAAYPREVMRSALDHGANSVVIVHNHPSGDPSPSFDDEKLTIEMYAAAQTLGIKLLDHIIIGHKKHYSFADAGKL